MHVIFVDDTKQPSTRRGMGKIIALGAISFPESEVRPFADAFREILRSHGIPQQVEIKWPTLFLSGTFFLLYIGCLS